MGAVSVCGAERRTMIGKGFRYHQGSESLVLGIDLFTSQCQLSEKVSEYDCAQKSESRGVNDNIS